MKIRRIISPDMRRAMAKLKEDLGPDAVILSTKKVPAGMEIVGAIDFDERDISAALNKLEQQADEKGDVQGSGVATHEDTFLGSGSREISAMREEIGQLRELMESQIAIIGWRKWSRKSPYRARLLRKMAALGIGSDLSNEILSRLAAEEDNDQLWPRALRILRDSIPIGADDVLRQGGVIALVGATGVGKTTTVAKLAARFAARHGNRDVALVSTDSYRIGAHDHLMAYGRILEVPVLIAGNKHELRDVLHGTRHKKLVLIDTAGMSQRDMRLAEQLATLKSEGERVTNYLVMSANTQTQGLNDIARAFNAARLNGCIITKEDEAVSLGGVLTVVARHSLPVVYVADGQRVPEDIHPARPDQLIRRAVTLASLEENHVDEESIAIRFNALGESARI